MRSDIFITSYYTVYAMTICYLTVTTDLGPLVEVLFLGSSTAKLFFVSPLSVCTLEVFAHLPKCAVGCGSKSP